MRPTLLSALLSIACFSSAWAFEAEDRAYFGPDDADGVIRIVSTADIDFFEPILGAFLAANPDTAVDYTVASSTELMRAIDDEGLPFDLAISSAMDLQTKLANDGFAQPHVSSATERLPEWAVWNDMLFTFTQEPAAIVVSKAAFAPDEVPRTRQELIDLLGSEHDRFRGRVGTYDVRQSGLGYLFATQDTRASETFWRLAQVLGGLDAKLYCCSSDMIEAVRSGELLVAYNVLGSYVANRDDSDLFEIILPSDFTTVMLRTALIPKSAENPELSAVFLDYLLDASQSAGTTPALDLERIEVTLNRIQLGPGLLVFLDQLKREAFLKEWDAAIFQGP